MQYPATLLCFTKWAQEQHRHHKEHLKIMINPTAWGNDKKYKRENKLWLNGAAWIIDRDKCEQLCSGDTRSAPRVAPHSVLCRCPTIACDFLLILQQWSVLCLVLTATLVFQCHFYWRLLCSNHLLSPLPLPFFCLSLSLSPSITDTTLSSERGKYRSHTLILFFCQQQWIGCLC